MNKKKYITIARLSLGQHKESSFFKPTQKSSETVNNNNGQMVSAPHFTRATKSKHKRFKRMLIYFDTETQSANVQGKLSF